MNELAPALVAALTDLTIVEKGHQADAGSYSYRYADLGDIVSLTRPVLARNGLVALTSVHEHGAGLAVTVQLLHTSGEAMEFKPLPFPAGKDAQSTGSAITYFRRYALLSALGMATGEDDDGAKAVPAPPEAAVPGFRSSLMAAVEKLTDPERVLLRDWLKAEGLPDRPSQMDADQSARVVDWLLNGMPKTDA